MRQLVLHILYLGILLVPDIPWHEDRLSQERTVVLSDRLLNLAHEEEWTETLVSRYYNPCIFPFLGRVLKPCELEVELLEVFVEEMRHVMLLMVSYNNENVLIVVYRRWILRFLDLGLQLLNFLLVILDEHAENRGLVCRRQLRPACFEHRERLLAAFQGLLKHV